MIKDKIVDRSLYYSAGEFAKLFNISKQTLFYYERNKIFMPEIVDEKGYRYYCVSQYFTFEIIINLKKLGIPLQKIANYLENRSISNLRDIYKQKQDDYLKEIEVLKKNIEHLDTKLQYLDHLPHITLNRVTLQHLGKEYLISSPFSSNNTNLKTKINQIAKHNLPFSQDQILREYSMGYILQKENLLKGEYLKISNVFTRVSGNENYKNTITKPHGLYAILYAPQGYQSNYKKALKILLDFIEKNDLYVCGNTYISPVRTCWSTDDLDKHITKIQIYVNYK